mgnify:CR=1 FL=1
MPAFVKGPDGEKAWGRASAEAEKQYPGLKDSDPDRFYAIVTTIMKNICKSDKYDCGGFGESRGTMRDMINRLEEVYLKKMGDPTARKMMAYDTGSKARNFAGELAMALVDKGAPEGELAAEFPKVKRTGMAAVKALEAFAKAVFDTEKYIDVPVARVHGRLGEETLVEALTMGGIKATFDRGMDRANQFARRVDRSPLASNFVSILRSVSADLAKLADSIRV